MDHKKKEKPLFYIKVECMWDKKFVIPFQMQQKKKGKLIRNTLKRNTGKLIEDIGSILQPSKTAHDECLNNCIIISDPKGWYEVEKTYPL